MSQTKNIDVIIVTNITGVIDMFMDKVEKITKLFYQYIKL